MSITEQELHRHAVRLAQAVELPEPFAFDAFAASLDVGRDRGVLISGFPGLHASGRSGLYVRFEDEGALDTIAYEQHTSELHQRLIVFREVAHMLWREAGLSSPDFEPLEPCCQDPSKNAQLS